jgi:acyl-CoA synthetase (AMP-forming)/AMP-acid ligase II
VVAVLQPLQANAQSKGSATHTAFPDAHALAKWCQQRTEAFKVPRQFWLCPSWPFTASGKTDHTQLAHALMQQYSQHHSQQHSPSTDNSLTPSSPTFTDLPCLQHLS